MAWSASQGSIKGPKGDKGDTGDTGPAVSDTGWISVTPTGFTGTLQYRIRAGIVFIKSALTGTIPVGATDVAAAGALPTEARPSGVTMRGVTYYSGHYEGSAYASTNGSVGVTQQTGADRTNPQLFITYPQA